MDGYQEPWLTEGSQALRRIRGNLDGRDVGLAAEQPAAGLREASAGQAGAVFGKCRRQGCRNRATRSDEKGGLVDQVDLHLGSRQRPAKLCSLELEPGDG